ncbi:MAG: phosphomethylpyrimidine synthase ThiC, partial [Pseudonocardiaceae bacterium]
MTTLHDRTIEPAVTTGPITGSRKVYQEVGEGLAVPVRRVDLSNGEHFDIYDTSGPYT